MNSFILRGDICFSLNSTQTSTIKNGYLVCKDGVCKGVFDNIPDKYKNLKLTDYSQKLIIPGLVDLHTHAPQYAFIGLGMDMELLEWLSNHTYTEESKYADTQYAAKAYEIFVNSLKNSATTRACIFATTHNDSTKILMDMLEQSSLVTYVGKVNMDRNAPENLCEKSAQQSLSDTKKWLDDIKGKYTCTYPILTPRFVPSCSDELLSGLYDIAKNYGVGLQSHLSENPDEVTLVKKLCPNSKSYADAYDRHNLFGNSVRTIMAHCVYLTDEEMQLSKANGVFVAHCPASNTNLSSGIAPVRKFLDMGIKVGLGTDVAGGHSLSMFNSIINAVSVSKLRYRLLDSKSPVTFDEAFFMATKGGGEFFGNVGSFEEGYEFDAVVLDDSSILHKQNLSLKERLERAVYQQADANCIVSKFVRGNKIF